MKNSHNNFIDGIGNTPLVKLKAASEITKCNIYGKAEYLNPGGSVKDRAALALIKDAEEKNLINKGGIVVEGTAGNTGIGLCLIGNSKGYKTVIVMNDNQTQEKKDTLKNIGADLRLVPPKPYKDEGNYVKIAGRLAEELKKTNNNGVVWANQFDNTANAKGHYETTGPEIWNQTEGKIDGFVCSSGTGGTISGVSRYLKEKNKNIKIYLSDPTGSALYNYIQNGELKSEGGSITEGIGSSRITANFGEAKIDGAFSISDQESLPILYDLILNEGLSLGTSCGVNIAGAIRLGKEIGPGKTIVTILCDKSDRYNSKLIDSIQNNVNIPIIIYCNNDECDSADYLGQYFKEDLFMDENIVLWFKEGFDIWEEKEYPIKVMPQEKNPSNIESVKAFSLLDNIDGDDYVLFLSLLLILIIYLKSGLTKYIPIIASLLLSYIFIFYRRFCWVQR